MAEARLSDGQVLRAVNDLFIGPRTHTSALYEIEFGARRMPDNGVIFSDGMEADYLRFTAGMQATVCVAERRGRLAV